MYGTGKDMFKNRISEYVQEYVRMCIYLFKEIVSFNGIDHPPKP